MMRDEDLGIHHSYTDGLRRAMMWPNAIAAATLVPHASPLPEHHLSTVCEGPGGFKVVMDVQQFAPKEVTVTTAENHVTVEGRHEEKPDEHGYISRHFLRRYTLPKEVDAQRVTCTLSSDGVLTIAAPKIHDHESGKERVVPILCTGSPSLPAPHHPHHAEKHATVHRHP